MTRNKQELLMVLTITTYIIVFGSLIITMDLI